MNLQKYSPKKIIELVIFNIRWLLIPFLLRLAYNIILLMYHWFSSGAIAAETTMVMVEAMDVVMIATLAEMIITGSYNSFISKDHGYHNKNISSGSLKVKMATSLITISSVHLLKVFITDKIDGNPITWDSYSFKLIIHMAFIIGGIATAWINLLHVKAEAIEVSNEIAEKEIIEEELNNHKTKKHEAPVLSIDSNGGDNNWG